MKRGRFFDLSLSLLAETEERKAQMTQRDSKSSNVTIRLIVAVAFLSVGCGSVDKSDPGEVAKAFLMCQFEMNRPSDYDPSRGLICGHEYSDLHDQIRDVGSNEFAHAYTRMCQDYNRFWRRTPKSGQKQFFDEIVYMDFHRSKEDQFSVTYPTRIIVSFGERTHRGFEGIEETLTLERRGKEWVVVRLGAVDEIVEIDPEVRLIRQLKSDNENLEKEVNEFRHKQNAFKTDPDVIELEARRAGLLRAGETVFDFGTSDKDRR